MANGIMILSYGKRFMINILKYYVILLCGFGCSAQTILPLFGETPRVPGAHYKDTFNDFDNYTGTWKFTSGTTELTIVLRKELHYHNTFSNKYQDIVYGEYKYILNGVEKINTMQALTTIPVDPFSNNIVGSGLNTVENYPVCTTCPAGQKRLSLSFTDPTRAHISGLRGRVTLRRVDAGGQQKLEMWLRSDGNISYKEGNPPEYDQLNVPYGKYILTKVN